MVGSALVVCRVTESLCDGAEVQIRQLQVDEYHRVKHDGSGGDSDYRVIMLDGQNDYSFV